MLNRINCWLGTYGNFCKWYLEWHLGTRLHQKFSPNLDNTIMDKRQVTLLNCEEIWIVKKKHYKQPCGFECTTMYLSDALTNRPLEHHTERAQDRLLWIKTADKITMNNPVDSNTRQSVLYTDATGTPYGNSARQAIYKHFRQAIYKHFRQICFVRKAITTILRIRTHDNLNTSQTLLRWNTIQK